ncbi:MAG TPA: 50S ribosomal protein L9 [Methylophaga aminisulfidivorans]|uniref:Large ribosomal subunit protein bL9 n=2 Tax=root TaxID=1 RepID=A0A7C1ZNR1_9GAMM|nr:50S ribosomal protein L9 [Methylophaga aminisulfidivorans]
MQVILLEKVQKLGNLGDEVAVKSGFGRNFLVPKGKALPATKLNREKFEARRADLEAAAAKVLGEAEARAAKLVAAGDLNIMANAGVEGKLFGSITAAEIADALNAAGADVDRNEVRLPSGPLRHTGEFNIDVQLHADVVVTVLLNITSEAELQAQAQAEEAKKARQAALEEAEAIAKAQEEE